MHRIPYNILHSLLVFALFLSSFLSTTLSVEAQRVVSLMPSVTVALAQIGADDAVVGRTSYCPKATNGKTVLVGDAMTVNIESIVALRPDVVVASNFTKQATVDRLKTLGIKVVQLSTPADFDDMCSQVQMLASLVGKSAEATKHIDDERVKVTAALKQIRQVLQQKGMAQTKVYVQVGTRPAFGATPDYYLGKMAADLGMTNALALGEGMCSKEEVMAHNPSLIIVSSMGGLGKDEAAEWRRLLTKSCVMVIDETVLTQPTPQNYRVTLEAIYANMLKPQQVTQ